MERMTTVRLYLPTGLDKIYERLLQEQGKTEDEFLSEALRRYIEETEWKRLQRIGARTAKEVGIREDQIEDVLDAHRK